MRTLLNRRAWAWLGMLLALPLLVVAGTTTTASAAGCSTGNLTGGALQGSWVRDYDPGACGGATQGKVTITWHSYLSGGDRFIEYDMSVWAGNINSNWCIQGSLDWAGDTTAGGSHEDAQIVRNCKEFTTRDMPAQTVNVDEFCTNYPLAYCSTNSWPTNRLQVGTYDPGLENLWDKECPATNGIIDGTDSLTECNGWDPVAPFSSKGAKIRLKNNAGSDSQNSPDWPEFYDIRDLVDPNN